MSKLDPADFNVITSAFKSIAAEMGDIMLQAAYSSIVREAKDCSTCIMDSEARTVSQAEMIPIHMNSLAATVPYIKKKYDISAIKRTEAYVTNNPYENGQHLNDIIFLLPVFFNNDLVAFTGSVCHHLELGGAVAGSNANATDLYQEGIIIPTMKIDLERDLGDGPVEQFLRANVRIPETILGDFHAQISATFRGRELVQNLFSRYDANLIQSCMFELQDYSERMLEAAISILPDGDYYGEDQLDGRTLDGEQPIIRAKVSIRGDRAQVDLSESDNQVNWPVNAPVASTHSAVLTVFGMLAGPGVPTNDGTYRPIQIKTRKGSILDPHHPAPVRGRMSSAYRAASAVKRALASAAPDRFSASGNDTTNAITMSRKKPDGFEMFAEILMGGNGAGPKNDGAEVVAQMLSNTGNTPIEAIEMNHDFIRVIEYSLIPDSGGAGKQRGGLGFRRIYEILDDGILITTNGDRHNTAPWGLAGGQEGNLSIYKLLQQDVEIPLPAASNIEVKKGDYFIVEISGGAGYGDPALRERNLVIEDLRCGRVTTNAALEKYNLTVNELAAE